MQFVEKYHRLIDSLVDWLTPRRLQLYPATLSVATILAWLISQFLGPGLIDGAKTIIGYDFSAFYTAGFFLLNGRLSQLYDPYAQLAFQRSLVAPYFTDKLQFFVSPPFVVPLYVPFVLLGYLPGLCLWWGMGLFALFWSLRCLRSELFPSHSWPISRLLLASFTFYPTLIWFFSAQSSTLVLLVYCLFFVQLRRGGDFWAGVLLGLLVYKPTLAIGLGLVLIFKWRWRALLGGFISAGLWVGAGLLAFPEMMLTYVRQSSVLLRGAMGDIWVGQSLNEFSLLLLENVWKPGATYLAGLLTCAAIVFLGLAWRRVDWRPGTRSWDFAMAMTVPLGFLISPHLYVYDVVLFLLPLAIVWSYYPHGTAGYALDKGPILAWTAMFYVTEFVYVYFAYFQYQLTSLMGWPPVALQIAPIVMAGWVWVVYQSGRENAIS